MKGKFLTSVFFSLSCISSTLVLPWRNLLKKPFRHSWEPVWSLFRILLAGCFAIEKFQITFKEKWLINRRSGRADVIVTRKVREFFFDGRLGNDSEWFIGLGGLINGEERYESKDSTFFKTSFLWQFCIFYSSTK